MTSHKTKMLASVTTVREAHIALDHGVDIIDLKNPSSGVLGALETDTVTEIVNIVRGRFPVSATVGNLPMESGALGAAVKGMITSGVDFVKIGLFSTPEGRDCISAIASYSRATRLVGVLFADQNPDFSLIPELGRAGFAGIMLDTADKSRGGLRSHADDSRLEEFVCRGKTLGLLTGLAGSLQIDDIPHLLKHTPDYLGFRGALCEHQDRTSSISHERVAAVRRGFNIDYVAAEAAEAAL